MSASHPDFDAGIAADLLERLRRTAPRVHCITNAVAQHFTANVLLALGAVPSMTIAPDEVAAFAAGADALLVNLGTLDDTRRDAIPKALEAAKAAGKPFVLDPVFVNRTPVRCSYAQDLLTASPTVLRANRDELAALYPGQDPLEALSRTSVTLAITGAEDLITGPGQTLRLANGHPLLARVTATGCAGGAVIAAFLAVSDDPVLAAAAALTVFNVAGEMAAERARGPGTLVPELLDALYLIDEVQIAGRLKRV
ncbi:hydroxyethylthiazole kinase [uncultured Roseibium sp.]|uniref:hydroxyethylthiazole kinase n=1 Tax=uncultured Roseibium sp. TaxID=1936171 RepID=UPI0032173419